MTGKLHWTSAEQSPSSANLEIQTIQFTVTRSCRATSLTVCVCMRAKTGHTKPARAEAETDTKQLQFESVGVVVSPASISGPDGIQAAQQKTWWPLQASARELDRCAPGGWEGKGKGWEGVGHSGTAEAPRLVRDENQPSIPAERHARRKRKESNCDVRSIGNVKRSSARSPKASNANRPPSARSLAYVVSKCECAQPQSRARR